MKNLKNKLVYARPSFAPHDIGYEDIGTCSEQEGLTLLEHYAGLAMKGMVEGISHVSFPEKVIAERIAEYSIIQAKALIAELEKQQ